MKRLKRRAAVALIGLLAVVCFGLLVSVAYPVGTSDPHARNPPDERFTVESADAYSATGKIVVDGEVELAFEGVSTPDGSWYQRVRQGNVTAEGYRPTANGTVYQRLAISGRNRAEKRRAQIRQDGDRRLVGERLDGDGGTFVVERNASGGTDPVAGTASVIVNSLFVAGYEATGTGSPAGTVYEPRSGWYDGRKPYRITGTSGEVRTGTDGRTVTSANVSWDVTAPAGTYAKYRLVRLTSDEPTTVRITFELDPDGETLERPAWVGEGDSRADGRTERDPTE